MPSSHYSLIKDYGVAVDSNGNPTSTPEISVTPFWILAVVRMGVPLTFSRLKMSSISNDSNEAFKTRNNTLIITSECTNLTIRGDKSSHLKTLNAQLIVGYTNFMAEILPGDYVFAWIVNDEEKAVDLIKRIKQAKACNQFDDGWKFFGKATSLRKILQKDKDSGRVFARFQLQAVGFKELDSSVFFDPFLAQKFQSVGTWMAALGVAINEVLAEGGAGISVNKIIPKFLDLLVGSGVPKQIENPSGERELQITTGLSGNNSAPYAYVVPAVVGKFMNREPGALKPRGFLGFGDVIELMQGLQRYNNGAFGKENDNYLIFSPDGVDKNTSPHRRNTKKDLLGHFQPQAPDIQNKTVWSILNTWLNPMINEMYTCLKVNNIGEIMPTIILRQIPFSTNIIAKNNPTIAEKQIEIPELSPFLEMPRWKMDASMVYEFDIGRTDATRFNFVHVTGQSPLVSAAINQTEQIIRNPPIRDDLDIQRNGVRPLTGQIACSNADTIELARAWLVIASDFHMGMHLTLSGTINCIGIQAPICEGDNLEFDGIVFHIESVLHSCNIDPGSKKRSFITSINLVNGMRSDSDPNYQEKDFPIYPNVFLNDNIDFNAGITQETDDRFSPELTEEDKKVLEHNKKEDELLQKSIDQFNKNPGIFKDDF